MRDTRRKRGCRCTRPGHDGKPCPGVVPPTHGICAACYAGSCEGREQTAPDATRCRCGHTRLSHPQGRCVIDTCRCAWFGPVPATGREQAWQCPACGVTLLIEGSQVPAHIDNCDGPEAERRGQTHDDLCESEFITGPMAWASCGCEERSTGREQAPQDRGCRWCQALPGEFCEEDCGGPAPVLHPDYREAEEDDRTPLSCAVRGCTNPTGPWHAVCLTHERATARRHTS